MTVAANMGKGLRELRLSLNISPAARRLLLALILVDAAFIAIHIIRTVALKYGIAPIDVALESPNLAIDKEGGYPEGWQQVKALGAAVLLVMAALRVRHAAVYGAWAALFAFAALDDRLAFHERAGDFLAGRFDFPRLGPLQGHDFGEVLVAAAAGIILIAAIVVAWRRSAPYHAARSALFVFPVAGLAVCGVGVDLLHVIVGYGFAGSYLLLTVLEDGGELLFTSSGCALAFTIYASADNAPDRRLSGMG